MFDQTTQGPPYHLFVDWLRKGRLVPFLGAGASLRDDSDKLTSEVSTGSMPTARELADLLLSRFGLTAGALDEFNPRNLLEVATYCEMYSDRHTLQKELRGIFLGAYQPGPLHRFLADLSQPLLIVTSNYDTLLEQAFLARQKPFHLVVTPAGRADLIDQVLWWKPNADKPELRRSKKFDLTLDDISIIFKIHGSVHAGDPEYDSFILTEEDYFEMAGRYFLKTLIPLSIQAQLAKSTILFLGYSLRDIHMRHAVRQVTKWLRPFAIVKGMTGMEPYFWQRLGVSAHQLLIRDFVEEMRKVMKSAEGSER